ncbi:MAG: carbon-nitrogen hydrolase family protein [Armatimonadetes bacterium]|nr:carbon-nitrogen hydrolase family protein [Armatimonadota bacterium]
MNALMLWAVMAPAELLPNGGFEEAAPNGLPAGWVVSSPRDETMPNILRDPAGGRGGTAAAGMVGFGRRTYGLWRNTAKGLTSGGWYRVSAAYRTDNVARPAESVRLQLLWQNAQGQGLRADYVYQGGPLADGWARLERVLQAPQNTASVELLLSLRGSAGTVWWDEVSVTAAEPQPPRKVKLATVCFMPANSTPEANRGLWAARVATAAEQGADIVCLGEGITVVGTGKSYAEVAEPIPGLTTDALGKAAAAHHVYIVAGIYETEGKELYNTAVLIGRDGQVAGRYRKTHLPESEAQAGLSPGDDYPVFTTDFGVIGIQICYDNSFPEVARALTLNGAEVIFTPIWGDGRYNGAAWDVVPRARAIDNSIWYVASNYSEQRSLIVSPWGEVKGDTAGKPGVVVVEANLDEARYTKWLSVEAGGIWRSLYPAERRPSTYGDLTR